MERHLYDLGESLVDAGTHLDRAFDLTVLDVADWLGCLDGEMLERMSDDVHALREEIAATADWFDTAAEYDFCETRRAVMRADSAVTSQDDSGLMEVWDRYWDTEVGSDEEFLAYYEFSLRRLLATLERIDDARSAAENAMPEGWKRAEGA